MDFFDSVFEDQDRRRRERPVHGVVIAKVTGRMGDGTYELRFLGMGGDAPSAPARMMMPSAGNKRGLYWMPEVGDEVVVAFESSDSNSPIILGALYNNQSPTPDQAKPSDENNVRTMVSRSGHEVTMDDSPLAGKVTVKTKGGLRLELDDTPPGKITLDTPLGLSIELDEISGTLTLTAPLAIKLAAPALELSAELPGGAPGGIINLKTTGVVTTSLVVIDGKPFGLHLHGLPPPAPPQTPPVQL